MQIQKCKFRCVLELLFDFDEIYVHRGIEYTTCDGGGSGDDDDDDAADVDDEDDDADSDADVDVDVGDDEACSTRAGSPHILHTVMHLLRFNHIFDCIRIH